MSPIPTQVRSPAPFYAFPSEHRPPFWRPGLFIIAVAGLHLLGLVLAFGAVARLPASEDLPVLSVRLLDPVPAARVEEARRVDPPRQRDRAKPLPAAPAPPRKLSMPAAVIASTAAAPTAFSVAQQAAARPAEAAVAAAPAAASPLVAARFDADYLHNPRPAYPPASRRLGEEGRVVLRVRVSAQGLAVAVDIRQSSGFARLDEAARAAVERWRFVPARQGSEAVESSVLVPLQFTLDS